jgi:hypothetical protein
MVALFHRGSIDRLQRRSKNGPTHGGPSDAAWKEGVLRIFGKQSEYHSLRAAEISQNSNGR